MFLEPSVPDLITMLSLSFVPVLGMTHALPNPLARKLAKPSKWCPSSQALEVVAE